MILSGRIGKKRGFEMVCFEGAQDWGGVVVGVLSNMVKVFQLEILSWW